MNVNVVANALKVVTGLLNGLGHHFDNHANTLAPVLLEKFKEQKEVVKAPLVECTEAMIEQVRAFLPTQFTSSCLVFHRQAPSGHGGGSEEAAPRCQSATELARLQSPLPFQPQLRKGVHEGRGADCRQGGRPCASEFAFRAPLTAIPTSGTPLTPRSAEWSDFWERKEPKRWPAAPTGTRKRYHYSTG